MLVPFGTHVLDRDGKSVGTVNSLVLHPDTQQGVAVVVQQGVLNRREIVVPLNKIASADKDVRLTLRADELADLDLYDAHPLRPMPDHWPMPMGFDLRSFFLVAGNGWTNAVLPFVRTSPTVSGTPAFVRDTDNQEEPAIAASTPVYDRKGHRIGDVEAVEIDPASARITRVPVREGLLFHHDTAIPASLIESVTSDRITVRLAADDLKKLESGLASKHEGIQGAHPSRP
jgi:uncharacterized protein YrrD